MFKKKEEPQQESGMLGGGKNYRVYRMDARDRLIAYGIGFLIGFLVSIAFFNNFIFGIICGVVGIIIAPRFYKEYRRKKIINTLRLQFKDLLDSLSASYSAGKNTLFAFEAAESDMADVFGPNSDIVAEIARINGGLKNNINVEILLSDFAQRSGIEDIQSFADVFEVCNRQGGNLKKVVGDTRDVLSEKIEIEMEIDTMLAGHKNELNIMIVMPVIVVFMLRSMGSGTANANTLTNIVLKLFCIGLFALAYVIGKKVTKINV